jgi:hypothetical protein
MVEREREKERERERERKKQEGDMVEINPSKAHCQPLPPTGIHLPQFHCLPTVYLKFEST